MKKLIKLKGKGSSDLISSLFMILALTIFVLFFIYSIGDIYTKVQMDQVARSYILRMESSGKLTSDEIQSLKSELMNIGAVRDAVELGNEIEVTWNSNNTSRGYGSKITLEIDCPAVVTGFNANKGTMGLLSRKNTIIFKIKKQSTAKY